jgi:hypothetical protein
MCDRRCGLVVRGPGSIPGATRFSEKWVVGLLSLASTAEGLREETVAALV